MSSTTLETAGEVAVLRLAHGKANALDTELCTELVSRFGELQASSCTAVVLTGRDGIFSAGVDLRRLDDGGPGYVREFLPALSDAFLAVFDFPRPVVAALNGHAIAGGAVLAAACDRRVLAGERAGIGVTELLVGVPFPLTALEILRCAFGTSALRGLVYLGAVHDGEDALRLGLADELSDQDTVLPRAIDLAERLGSLGADAFGHTKAQLHRPFIERIGEQRPGDDARVEKIWTSDEALASISAYVERVLKKNG
ncbi:enoyl-CoA hydratase/isomerase family protein [Amycolatopsis minnesotensis]|uniref:Enoyl-CoA hydratase/isomerase family protein n=1 Tax=Amycolatopsis minnesotensis TaxID=337894 RepID=A0ABP5BRW7_9PSEU